MQPILTQLVAIMLAGCVAGCQPNGDDLARLGTTSIKLPEFREFVLRLPPDQRIRPAGTDHAEWITGLLERLALRHALHSSDAYAALAASPEHAATRVRSRVAALEARMVGSLTAGEVPDDLLRERVARYMASRPESVINFQHIFFRSHRPGSSMEQAQAVLERIRSGESFADLAREFSDSASAAMGGLVQNARSGDLAPEYRETLAGLQEGEVSPVVESRTGLHIFRLIRSLQPEAAEPEEASARIRQVLAQEQLSRAREELLVELRQRMALQQVDGGWRVGEFHLGADVLAVLLPGGAGDAAQADLLDSIRLASAAEQRGMADAELEAQLTRAAENWALARVMQQRREDYHRSIENHRLLDLYQSQPSLFSTPAKTHLHLIFVPEGADAYSTQLELEALVQKLRSGASFADSARQLSVGPGAENGGDLGLLPAREVERLGPSVAAEVLNLKPGEVSQPVYCTGRVLSQDPIMLKGGFAILKLAGREPAVERSFEDAVADVRVAFAAQHRRQLDEELMQGILARGDFQILRLPDLAELALP